jgi:hypothetical protein
MPEDLARNCHLSRLVPYISREYFGHHYSNVYEQTQLVWEKNGTVNTLNHDSEQWNASSLLSLLYVFIHCLLCLTASIPQIIPMYDR